MIERLTAKALLLLLSLLPGRAAAFGRAGSRASPPPISPRSQLVPQLATNGFHPITPGPIDGQIATLTAYLLQLHHYLKKPFDESVSSQFLDRYLETLDPQHIHFTQADLAEFEHYRTNLNHLTSTGRRPSDTRPACEIFNRFMERLEQRTAYAE